MFSIFNVYQLQEKAHVQRNHQKYKFDPPRAQTIYKATIYLISINETFLKLKDLTNQFSNVATANIFKPKELSLPKPEPPLNDQHLQLSEIEPKELFEGKHSRVKKIEPIEQMDEEDSILEEKPKKNKSRISKSASKRNLATDCDAPKSMMCVVVNSAVYPTPIKKNCN